MQIDNKPEAKTSLSGDRVTSGLAVRRRIRPEHSAVNFHKTAAYRSAEDTTKRLLKQVAEATTRVRRRLVVDRFLRSPEAALYYARKGYSSAKLLRETYPDEVYALARRLDAFSPCAEPVAMHEETIGSKVRRLVNCGPERRAIQSMAKALMEALSPARDDQFGRRGIKKALEAFNRAIKDGFVFGVELDLANFYPSVKLGHLMEARKGLPVQVIENVIWMDVETPVIPCMAARKQRGPIGLAQGGVSSPAAAEKIIEGILGSLPETVCVINYADNVFVLGVTSMAVEHAKTILEDRARQLSAGPLIFRAVSEVSDLRVTGVSFLGAHGGYDEVTRHLIWEPGEAAKVKIEAEIEANQSDISSIELALHRINSWYSICDEWPERTEWALTRRAQLLAKAAYCVPGCGGMAFMREIAACYLASQHPMSITKISHHPPIFPRMCQIKRA